MKNVDADIVNRYDFVYLFKDFIMELINNRKEKMDALKAVEDMLLGNSFDSSNVGYQYLCQKYVDYNIHKKNIDMKLIQVKNIHKENMLNLLCELYKYIEGEQGDLKYTTSKLDIVNEYLYLLLNDNNRLTREDINRKKFVKGNNKYVHPASESNKEFVTTTHTYILDNEVSRKKVYTFIK